MTSESSSLLSEETLVALGLQQQPFAPPTKDDEFYTTQSIEMVIKIVLQHLSEDNMVLLVKGEAGGGKSCFIDIVRNQAPEALIFTLTTAHHNISSIQLLEQILPKEQRQSDLDLETITKETALEFFKQMSEARQPVLVVDDAHLIPFKVLATLFKFLRAISNQGRGRVKLMLVGENSIDKNLDGLESRLLDKSSIFSTLLRPFNQAQTEEYLGFRLQQAGFSKEMMPLTEKQLNAIYQNSGGIPNNINIEFIKQLDNDPLEDQKPGIMKYALEKLTKDIKLHRSQ